MGRRPAGGRLPLHALEYYKQVRANKLGAAPCHLSAGRGEVLSPGGSQGAVEPYQGGSGFHLLGSVLMRAHLISWTALLAALPSFSAGSDWSLVPAAFMGDAMGDDPAHPTFVHCLSMATEG